MGCLPNGVMIRSIFALFGLAICAYSEVLSTEGSGVNASGFAASKGKAEKIEPPSARDPGKAAGVNASGFAASQGKAEKIENASARHPGKAATRLVNASAVKAEPRVATSTEPAALQVAKQKSFSALQHARPNRPKKIRHEGEHFLNRKQLSPIRSVHCLQEKQRNPWLPCVETDEKPLRGPYNIGRFPDWKDSICHSNYEFFCDPESILNHEEQNVIHERLQQFRERTHVNCGQLKDALDPDTERRWYEKKWPIHRGRLGIEDYRPFNLAVVLVEEWPSSEMDARSMQYFGRRIMSTWGLNPIYNGVDSGNSVSQSVYTWDEYQQNCPNTAILIILPKYHQAFLSSPSCEFLCASRGGPEVIAETLAALEKDGPAAAVEAGISEIDRALKVALPLSLKKMPNWVHSGRNGARYSSKVDKQRDASFTLLFRGLFVLIVGLFVVGVLAFVYYVLLAQKPKRLRSITDNVTSQSAVRDAWLEEAHDRAQQAQPIAIGELVERRNRGDVGWGIGYVTSINPLKTTLSTIDPSLPGYPCDEVRRINRQA